MFFEDVKKIRSRTNDYEYNTAMADVCVLNAINAYHEGDADMVRFFKKAESEFRRRAMDGTTWNKEQIMKFSQSLKSPILKHGHKTRSGTCIY